MDTSWRRCISVYFPPHEVRPVSEILRFHRASSPSHRLAPDGNGGYKDRTTDWHEHQALLHWFPLCFGGVGGKNAGKRIEKIKERMKDNHPNVKSLGSDPNNPPANIQENEIGEGNFIYNCCIKCILAILVWPT